MECIELISLQGFPNGVDWWGGQFGKNGQKLHENYKINISGAKQCVWGRGGMTRGEQRERQANFSGSGGIPSLAETMDCINIREILEAAKLHFNIFLY